MRNCHWETRQGPLVTGSSCVPVSPEPDLTRPRGVVPHMLASMRSLSFFVFNEDFPFAFRFSPYPPTLTLHCRALTCSLLAQHLTRSQSPLS